MENLLIGFALGAIASWLWHRRFAADWSFRQQLHRELQAKAPVIGQGELEKKVTELDQRLQALQQSAVIQRAMVEATPQASGDPQGRLAVRSKREQKSVVLSMHKEGKPFEEIAARTGMGKGEVELLVKIKDKMA